MRRLLRGVDGAPEWSLVLCAHSYSPADVGLLGKLAAFASATHTPFIVAADPSFVGADSFEDGADVDDWSTTPPSGWDDLRRAPGAHYLAVAIPRFLVRVPYGTRTDAIDSMAFEEFGDGVAPHGHFLWANPVFLAGLIASEEVERGEAPRSHGTIGGLPFYTVKIDGVSQAKPCAEALMSQRTAMHLLDLGLTALVSEKDGDSVRIPRLQSIATPPAPLAVHAVGGQS